MAAFCKNLHFGEKDSKLWGTSCISNAPFSVLKQLVHQEWFLAQRIRAIKKEVVHGRTPPEKVSLVRPEVVKSWLRSRDYGLSLERYSPPPVLDDASLARLSEENDLLLKAAKPYISWLKREALCEKFTVHLGDREGTFLLVACGKDKARKRVCEQLGVIPGALWREATVGTCAHVLSLITKGPVQLWGPEHYSNDEVWQGVTCSSAPIFDAFGNLAGVLSVSSNSYYRQGPNTLRMVASIALAIQQHFQNLTKEAVFASIFANAEEYAFVVINERGLIVRVNKQALDILSPVCANPVGHHFEAVLGGKSEYFIHTALQCNQSFRDIEIELEQAHPPLLLRGDILCIKNDLEKACGCLVVIKGVNRRSSFKGSKEHPSSKSLDLSLHGFRSSRTASEMKTISFDGITIILGSSPRLANAIALAQKVAPTDANILLQGESGTGKDVFARYIHHLSRPGKPFIALNCAAIPKSLIESELFGYEGGSFTGADRKGRRGKIELAQGGTLFLDEIGDMPLELQPALLRVLEEKRLMRVGGNCYLPVDFRLIAASNRNLLEEVRRGNFRLDLYYRIAIFKITLPPLRDRGSDILELAHYFIQAVSEKLEIPPPALSDDAKRRLLEHPWPGNVRELQNAILHAVSMCQGGVIRASDLPEEIGGNETLLSLPAPSGVSASAALSPDSSALSGSDEALLPVKEMEKRAITRALLQTDYNIREAAAILGLSKSTLYRKIQEYGLRPSPRRRSHETYTYN